MRLLLMSAIFCTQTSQLQQTCDSMQLVIPFNLSMLVHKHVLCDKHVEYLIKKKKN